MSRSFLRLQVTLLPCICAATLLASTACDEDEQASEEAAQAQPDSAPLEEPVPRAPEAVWRTDPGDAESKPVSHAVAIMRPTEGHQVEGTIRFNALGDTPGLAITADLEQLPPGTHAFHVHLLGDCTAADGTSAGTHFNFEGSSEDPPSDIDRITGNLGELEAGDDGKVHLETEIDGPRLQGPYSLLGRSVIVHAKANDPDQPPIGAAGGRLACGVIGVAKP